MFTIDMTSLTPIAQFHASVIVVVPSKYCAQEHNITTETFDHDKDVSNLLLVELQQCMVRNKFSTFRYLIDRVKQYHVESSVQNSVEFPIVKTGRN